MPKKKSKNKTKTRTKFGGNLSLYEVRKKTKQLERKKLENLDYDRFKNYYCKPRDFEFQCKKKYKNRYKNNMLDYNIPYMNYPRYSNRRNKNIDKMITELKKISKRLFGTKKRFSKKI